MPKYFFNLHRKSEVIPDPEGQDLPDLDAARTEAIQGAREIAAERVKSGVLLDLHDNFEIADEAGRVLETVRFSEALKIIGVDRSK